MHKKTVIQYFRLFIISLIICYVPPSCKESQSARGPVKPGDALSTFEIADGFKIEMIASEPLVSSPVDMEIDEYGRMYVVEMHGYPLDVSGSGNIILLADTDGDGRMDKRTVFMDKLVLPTGIQRWKKGVIVTDAPHVYYLEDTDGDGRADKVDTLLTGFALTNPQHNMNNPVYGLDNWIYIAHEGAVRTRDYAREFGGTGSEIRFPGWEDGKRLPVNANGRSIRFQPDQKNLEMMASRCQFGHSFDEWGNWFGCNNSNQGYQEIIANRYFERNPYLLAANATHSMSDHKDMPELFPITTHPDRQLLTDIGVMTAGSGLTAYLGNAFPAPYNGRLTFITESVSNIVHVDALRDSGVSFVASRILPNKEFLASTDAWHRPVNLYVGPDGALYLLDYYRRVIESPEWMSKEAIEAGNLYDGVDMGRIYRITPVDAAPAAWMKGLALGDAPSSGLVQQLANPNNWWRMHAQRVLVDRKDADVLPLLKEMTTASSEMGRLHALWVLEGMNALTPGIIIQALNDTVAGIRVNAIKLAELHWSDMPQLEQHLRLLENDTDIKVRFQLLLTLGYSKDPRSAQVRDHLLFRDIADDWVQVAALSAPPEQTAPLLNIVLRQYREKDPAYASLVKRLTEMTGASASLPDITGLIHTACRQQSQRSWQGAMLNGLTSGIRNRKTDIELPENTTTLLVNTFFETGDNVLRNACYQMLHLTGISNETVKEASIQKALSIVNNKNEDPVRRADAVSFLALGNPQLHYDLLVSLITPNEKTNVQQAALRTLATVPDPDPLCSYLIKEWPVLGSQVREDAVGILMSSEEKIALLIDALEKEQIPVSDVSFPRSVYLMQVKDDSLKDRARKVFTRNNQSAKEINRKFQKALQRTGDAEKGLTVFLTHCAICHQVRGEKGVAIGPDLGTVHNWKKEDLMANILDPNLAIFPGFDIWDIKLGSGESIQGIIAGETASAITLRNQGMVDRTVNRQDIETMKSLNLSAMPTGYDKKISIEEMADLIAFLKKH